MCYKNSLGCPAKSDEFEDSVSPKCIVASNMLEWCTA